MFLVAGPPTVEANGGYKLGHSFMCMVGTPAAEADYETRHVHLSLCMFAGTPTAEATDGRLEVDLEGSCLQLDSFPQDSSPYAWRLAFSIHRFEVSIIVAHPRQ